MRLPIFHQVLKRANAERLKELCFCSSYTGSRYFSSTGRLLEEVKNKDKLTKEDEPSKGSFKEVLKKKYSDTLQLPKSEFPMKISYDKRNEHELKIADKVQFDQLYSLQRLWRQEHPEFILHDGPPYANGNVHIGHAVNKILKDFTNRYKLLRGYKINYIPGWDCHGLPIELKAIKSNQSKNVYLKDPKDIREKAKEIVETSINSQKESFRRWGVMAEWESVYRTADKGMLQAQLRAFYTLYKKGLVFRDLKPVHWSPSSGTCLAEAELEYDPKHESPSVYLNLDVDTDLHKFASLVGKDVSKEENGPIKAVIWTTTPWTLPSNKAIAFSEKQEYSLVKYSHRTDKSYLIIASHLVQQVAAECGKSFTPVFSFPGSHLAKLQYYHPWFDNQLCQFLHGDHVAGDKGTGLVHTAPAHGQDDFVLGLKHNLGMDCYVDNTGSFDSQIAKLKGLPVLSGGNKAVLNHLKGKILRESTIVHSYPYDWRTKKPVIMKASLQWFLDTGKIKSAAVDQLKEVNIYPTNVQNAMGPMIESRPYWCISRQRSWGVPIPVLYRKDSGEPYIDEAVINRMCKLIETTSGLDFWWSVPVSDLVEDETLASKLTKGTDIFDIWLDSGLTWQIFGDKVADLYLEGVDQFQGWFQSSLLTSVAIRDKSPYKNLYVHGFVVDEEGHKMSKSIGNVVDPRAIISGSKEKERKTPAYGADVLRWWVAAQGSADGTNCTISNSFLQAADDGVQKIRNVLKFLISFANEKTLTDIDVNQISYNELMYTDQYMLSTLREFQQQVTEYYQVMNYHRVLMRALHFATTEISAHYLTWIKDRLYCDHKNSESRKSCIFVLNEIYLTLSKVLAPILPFLIEESYSHYQIANHSIFRSLWFDMKNENWNNQQIATMFKLVLDIRECLNHVIGANNPKDIWVELVCTPEVYKELQLLHPAMDSDLADKCDSELCDILQVSGVSLKCFESDSTASELANVKFDFEPIGVSHSVEGYSLGISKTQMTQCARCRRFCCEEGSVLCLRCMSVMQRLLQKQSKEEAAAANNHPEELKTAMCKKT